MQLLSTTGKVKGITPPAFGLKTTTTKRRQLMDSALVARFKMKAGRANAQTLIAPNDASFKGTGKLLPNGSIELNMKISGSHHDETTAVVTPSGTFLKLTVSSQATDDDGTLAGKAELLDIVALKAGKKPARPFESTTMNRLVADPELAVYAQIHMLERFMLILMGEDKV